MMKMNKWMRSLDGLDLTILCLLLTSVFFILFNFEYVPVYMTFVANADVLFIEEIARYINAGGNLFDWKLPQAPYLFPDIFLSRIIAYFVPEIGQVASYYTTLFALLVFALVLWLTRVMQVKALLPVFTAVFLYLLMYTGNMTGDVISIYFGMVGCHAGIIIPLLLTLTGVILYFKEGSQSSAPLLLIFVSMFLGIVSDSLVAFATVPFLTAFLMLLWWKKEISRESALQFFGFLILTTLLAKAFGFTNPFPQDREFLSYVLHNFPDWQLIALKAFPLDFVKYFFTSPISGLIAILYFSSWFIAFNHIRACYRSQTQANTSDTILALFIMISPIFVILLQLALGIYHELNHSRQWAPLIYLSIVFGAILIENLYKDKLVLVKKVFVALLIINLIMVTYTFSRHRNHLPLVNEYPNFVACMKEHHLPEGNFYAADYWMARPTRMYSNQAYGITVYDGGAPEGPGLFTIMSNIAQIREGTPRFMIIGQSVKEDKIVNQFGQPAAEYCSMTIDGMQLKILDYSNNAAFKDYFRKKAIQSY